MSYLIKFRGLEVFCNSAREVSLLADEAELRWARQFEADAPEPDVRVQDEATWPGEAQAASILGRSIKTLMRYAEQRKIEVRKRPIPGRKPMNIFNPRDLQRLKTRSFSIQ